MGKREENARKKKIKRIAVKTVAWIILIIGIVDILLNLFGILSENISGWIFLTSCILFLSWLYFFAKYFEPYTKAYKFAIKK